MVTPANTLVYHVWRLPYYQGVTYVYVDVYNVAENQLILDEIYYYIKVFPKIGPKVTKIDVVSIGHEISYENYLKYRTNVSSLCTRNLGFFVQNYYLIYCHTNVSKGLWNYKLFHSHFDTPLTTYVTLKINNHLWKRHFQ